MSHGSSTTTKPRSFKMAYLLDGDSLRQLDRFLEKEVLVQARPPGNYEDAFKKELDYRVNFSDGSNLQTTSIDEIADLPNSRERRITAITVNTPYWNRDLRARIGFRSDRHLAPIEYEVSGEASAALHLADKLDQHLLAFRQWYSPIIRVGFLGIALLFALLLFLSANVIAVVYGFESDPSQAQSVVGALIYVGIFAIGALLDWFRGTLFPVATFAIGQGVARNDSRKFWRGTVVLGLFLSLVGSLLVELLLYLI